MQGSNGEAQHLSRDERKAAIRLVRDTLDVNGFERVLVIAGTGAQSTRETKFFNADAADAGASHALILTPSTWRPSMSKEHILRFHREVRSAPPPFSASRTDPTQNCVYVIRSLGRGCLPDPDYDLQLPRRHRRARPRLGHD